MRVHPSIELCYGAKKRSVPGVGGTCLGLLPIDRRVRSRYWAAILRGESIDSFDTPDETLIRISLGSLLESCVKQLFKPFSEANVRGSNRVNNR